MKICIISPSDLQRLIQENIQYTEQTIIDIKI